MGEKISRKIYQPRKITNWLITQEAERTCKSENEVTNQSIILSKMPKMPHLKEKAEFILYAVENDITLSQQQLKDILAGTIEDLADTPIRSSLTIEKAFSYYVSRWQESLEHRYFLKVTTYDDEILRTLNDMLYSGNEDFFIGKREFGYRVAEVLRQWTRLCVFRDTYRALSVIARHMDIKGELDPFDVLMFLVSVDDDLHSQGVPAEEIINSFPSCSIPKEKRVSAIRSEIYSYYGNQAYAYLTGDIEYKNVPEEVTQLWYDAFDDLEKWRLAEKTVEEQLEIVSNLLMRCKKIFSKLR